MEAAGVPGVAEPLRVHLRLEFHDEGAQAGVTCPRDWRAAAGWGLLKAIAGRQDDPGGPVIAARP
jgi:hypothetical protein